MSITVVLAVGLDSWQLMAQNSVWRSAGYIVISAFTIREAIEHFRAGDFDLVLLGRSISTEDKERLTFQIRTFGSQTPVVCIANSSADCNSFATATLNDDSSALLRSMEEVLARESKVYTLTQTSLQR